MTSPQHAPTPQDLLRRVHSMNPAPPEHAEVTLDLSRIPLADVAFLTIDKWVLSSATDWPLLAERRGELDRQKATRGLTDDEVRRVVYDDLKRSFWRPLPSDVTLNWDDARLQLAVSWSPSGQNAAPVFATLSGLTGSSVSDIVDAGPGSAAEFTKALRDAAQPPPPTGAAFRIEFADLRYHRAETARTCYERFKQIFDHYGRMLSVQDPRVRFDDNALTLELDDWDSLMQSGLRDEVVRLAELQPSGSIVQHAGAPAPGTRTFEMAAESAALRKVEHAFGQPGHAEYRQAERRALAAGLSYGSIARAYEHYDQQLPHGARDQIDGAVLDAAQTGQYDLAFGRLAAAGGFVIGEHHDRPDAFCFVSRHMAELQQAGVTKIVCEGLRAVNQRDLDEFVYGTAGKISKGLLKHVRALDRNRDAGKAVPPHAMEAFLAQAQSCRMPIVGAEHPAALYSAGAGRITEPNNASTYDAQKRLARYNQVAADRHVEQQPNTTTGAVLHICGFHHVHTDEFGYPGIAQLRALPAVEVAATGDKLTLIPLRENRGLRMTDLPARPQPPEIPVSAVPSASPKRATSHTPRMTSQPSGGQVPPPT